MKPLPFFLAVASMTLSSYTALAKDSAAPMQKHEKTVHAGQYLVSRFAQNHHDWDMAAFSLKPLVEHDGAHDNLLQRAMILSIGSGDIDHALKIARRIKRSAPDMKNTVIDVLFIAEAIKNDDFQTAHELFIQTPKDATMNFIGPFLQGWIDAGNGNMNITYLQGNTAQLYHGILISDFLNDYSHIEKMIAKALTVEDISSYELERIADLYGHVGLRDKALEIYDLILKSNPENDIVQSKRERLSSNTGEPLFQNIDTAQRGAAQAFTDIARILHQQGTDETARIFAHLGLYLAPDLNSTVFLLSQLYAQHEQYDKALLLYKTIQKSPEADFIRAQLSISDIYIELERYDAALAHLQKLEKEYGDVSTTMKIGDLHRSQGKFDLSLKSYDRAVEQLGTPLPAEYWYLHYSRGISYEQTGRWEKAEKELKAALSYQPNHPYILNYLGYAWADQGVHLPEALSMIKKAVQLRPSDGYITDSLGWVMYRVEDYYNAVKALERAVELLPYDPTVNDHLGDAYWKVGRKLEARFQWERAKNHSDDADQLESISQKLKYGLD